MSAVARQVDFDAVVKDLIESNGLSLEDAAAEAKEVFSSEYDTSGLFIYSSTDELNEKLKMETRLKTIDAASRGTETFVNASFALQGIQQLLGRNANNAITRGSWKLVESRKLLSSLVRMLVIKDEEEKSDARAAAVEDDSDGEDEDEEKLLQTLTVLENAIFVAGNAISNPTLFRDARSMLLIEGELVEVLYARLDEDIAEARVVNKMVELLCILLTVEENKAIFLNLSGVALLELAIKMHKREKALLEKINGLIAALA